MKFLIISILLIAAIIAIMSYNPFPIDIIEPVDDEPVEEIENQEDNMYMVSHSEYWSGEQGQIITRLLNYKGVPIAANCLVDVLYPNRTYFTQNATMTFSIDSYYYQFTTPDTVGVYQYKAECSYANKNRSIMNSFHLSPALNFIQISHDNLSGQLVDLTDLNNAHFGNITYNLTQIKQDTDYIRNNLVTNGSLSETQTNIISQLNNISAFCGSEDTVDSVLCSWVNETRVRLINMNTTVDSYLQTINLTTDISAGIILDINETVSGLGQFNDNDRWMVEKIYNCTILGQGCWLTEIRIWNYSGRYIHGENP